MSSTIGEPFQLFLSSNLSRRTQYCDAVSCTHNHNFPGYATVTAQGDGVHVWDLKNLHAVASYSVGEHVAFAVPAFSLPITEDGTKSIISYTVLGYTPGGKTIHRGRTIWVIRHSLSGSTVAASDMTAVVIELPIIKICGTGRTTVPLLLISKNANLFLANTQIEIKSQLDWPGERQHLETFVFPRESCSFIQDDTTSCSSAAVTCCQTGMIVHVRLTLLGEEIVPFGTCDIPIASSTSDTDVAILGLTCSPSGILSFIDSRGVWAAYQLISLNSSLVPTPVSEYLNLRRFSALNNEKPTVGNGLSIVSLGTSLVLLAALVEDTQDITLQIWDLFYGVLLSMQSMPIPSGLTSAFLRLTVADQGQVLLTVSPTHSHPDKNHKFKRSSIYVVPVDAWLKSTLASALGKTALTARWSIPNTVNDRETNEEGGSTKIISEVRTLLQKKNAQSAEQAFLKWVNSQSSSEAALGHEFVKEVFNTVLPQEPLAGYPYTPCITRCLLENAIVSNIMLNGRLITALRQRSDWENVMLALKTVADISEDELMASAKFLIDKQRRAESSMDVDTLEGYVPPLWTYLSACVSYPFSAAPMRLAIRKHLPNAQDLVPVLEILESWVQGGTEQEMEALLKSLASNAKVASSGVNSPLYPKVIMFLQALLDASFIALLQYQPSYDLLRRILSDIEPEIMLIDSLEPLRGMLEPFVKAQRLKERMSMSKESLTEWKKRRKQLDQQDGLSVGLYRLEELVL